MNRLTPEAYRESRKLPLVVVLDHIRSLNNVGSVFRTSDAFRVEAIYSRPLKTSRRKVTSSVPSNRPKEA